MWHFNFFAIISNNNAVSLGRPLPVQALFIRTVCWVSVLFFGNSFALNSPGNCSIWPVFSQSCSLRISVGAIRAYFTLKGTLTVKSVTHSHFTSFFTDSPRLEVNDFPITSPVPLSKLVKADPSQCPACLDRRQSSTHNVRTQTHDPSFCFSHTCEDRQKCTHKAANVPTYKDTRL